MQHKPLTFHQIQARVRHQLNWQHQNRFQHQNKIRHPHQKWNSEPEMSIQLKIELESEKCIGWRY